MYAYPNDNDYLDDLLTEQPLITTTSANANLFSTTTANNLLSQTNQQLMPGEEFSTNGTSSTMNDTQEQFYSFGNDDFPHYTTDVNASNEHIEASENANSYSCQQKNGHVYFCNWFIEKLQHQVNHVSGYLPSHMLADHQRFMQDCEQNPQNLLTQEGFNMLLTTIQYGLQISQSCNQDPDIGKETNEMFDAYTLPPLDENEDHTAEEIRALAQSNPPMSHTMPKQTLDLSSLLLEQKETIQGEISVNLKLVHPPKPFWHARTTNCLFKKQCAPLQSTKERQLIVLEWSNSTNLNENDLYVLVKLLDYNGETHLEKFIVPPGSVVEDLDSQLTTVKHPVNANRITLPVLMFNPFKPKNKCKETRDSNLNQIDLDFVKDELVKICKLRIEMCRLTNIGQLECICQFVDTNFIKESKNTKELEIELVNGSPITPKKPCKCGHEDITVLLNTSSEKAGFIVMINNKQLKIDEFDGVTNKELTIHPPQKPPQAHDFHLMIKKINVLKTIELNRNPFDRNNLIIDTLLNTNVEYTNYNGDCPHMNQKKKLRKQ